MIHHPIKPVFDSESRILILGSFPSVKSREQGFFYGHPQNRFWSVISSVCSCDIPRSIEEKRNLLLDNHIALWDVINSCEIIGSSDSSIKNAVPNNLNTILDSANIKYIFTNGAKAHSLYEKYCEKSTGIKALCLPSTSPANAAWSREKLFRVWGQALRDTGLF